MDNLFRARVQTLSAQLKNMGAFSTAFYAVQRIRRSSFAPGSTYRLYSSTAKYPVFCRAQTSDSEVFRQIFIHREYRCLDDITDAGLVIDCGANVGYASAYFLTRYPRCELIAVEPDPDNFAVLSKNLAPYAGRFKAIQTGVWCRKAGLVMSEETFGDGREWARTVREAREGETPAMYATDIGSLLKESGRERISILKIDIEGAESKVFAENYQDWLDRVDNLVIELHGAECAAVFHKAIASQGYAIDRCDELTVCRRTAN